MPYKRVGENVLVKRDGWHKKAKARSVANANKMMRLLRMIEHGGTPRGRRKR